MTTFVNVSKEDVSWNWAKYYKLKPGESVEAPADMLPYLRSTLRKTCGPEAIKTAEELGHIHQHSWAKKQAELDAREKALGQQALDLASQLASFGDLKARLEMLESSKVTLGATTSGAVVAEQAGTETVILPPMQDEVDPDLIAEINERSLRAQIESEKVKGEQLRSRKTK